MNKVHSIALFYRRENWGSAGLNHVSNTQVLNAEITKCNGALSLTVYAKENAIIICVKAVFGILARFFVHGPLSHFWSFDSHLPSAWCPIAFPILLAFLILFHYLSSLRPAAVGF